MKRILYILSTILISAGCSPEKVQLQVLILKPAKLNLVVGETATLTVSTVPTDCEVSLDWSSSDTKVATVSSSGVVKAISKGSATITVKAEGKSETATVTVKKPSSEESGYLDPRAALASPLSNSIIFSKGTQLVKKGNIMQGFDFTDETHFYYSQSPSGKADQYISFVPGPSKTYTSYMTLKHFGHMTQIVAEEASDGTYIWLNSNGQYSESDNEYHTNLTVSRVKYVPGTTLSDGYAGETFFFGKKHSNGKAYMDLQPSIDFNRRRILIGCRVSGGDARFHFIYDLDEIMALPLKKTEVTVNTSEGTVTRSFMARDLSDAKQLGYFEVKSHLSDSDKSQTYSYSHQGHCIYGEFVWFYEGSVVSADNRSYAFLTVFDYDGNVVIPRTEVKAIADNEAMKSFDFTYDGSAEGESLQIKDDVLYLGFAAHSSATSSNRIQNILYYDLSK